MATSRTQARRWSRRNPMSDDFNKFMLEFPFWMLYVRADRRFPCLHCYDESTHSEKINCHYCFATGYKVSFQRFPCVQVSRPNVSRLQGGPLIAAGWIENYDAVILAPRELNPEAHDYICEVEWDKDYTSIQYGSRPMNLQNTWEVVFTTQEADAGIAYYVIGCSTHINAHTLLGEQLLNISNIETLRMRSKRS